MPLSPGTTLFERTPREPLCIELSLAEGDRGERVPVIPAKCPNFTTCHAAAAFFTNCKRGEFGLPLGCFSDRFPGGQQRHAYHRTQDRTHQHADLCGT